MGSRIVESLTILAGMGLALWIKIAALIGPVIPAQYPQATGIDRFLSSAFASGDVIFYPAMVVGVTFLVMIWKPKWLGFLGF